MRFVSQVKAFEKALTKLYLLLIIFHFCFDLKPIEIPSHFKVKLISTFGSMLPGIISNRLKMLMMLFLMLSKANFWPMQFREPYGEKV